MPQELTDEQRDDLRRRLQEERATLQTALVGADERSETVELDGSMGRLSRMDALQQQEVAKAQARQARQRLKTVLGALRRIETDDYGWCPDCGELIGYKRLAVRPEAPFCVPCSARRGG